MSPWSTSNIFLVNVGTEKSAFQQVDLPEVLM